MSDYTTIEARTTEEDLVTMTYGEAVVLIHEATTDLLERVLKDGRVRGLTDHSNDFLCDWLRKRS